MLGIHFKVLWLSQRHHSALIISMRECFGEFQCLAELNSQQAWNLAQHGLPGLSKSSELLLARGGFGLEKRCCVAVSEVADQAGIDGEEVKCKYWPRSHLCDKASL